MRRERQHQHTVDYMALAYAHAQGRSIPQTVVTTKQCGEIVGQRTKWHRVVQEVASRIIDYSIKKYRKCPEQWNWLINTITMEMNSMFIFKLVPVRKDVLE